MPQIAKWLTLIGALAFGVSVSPALAQPAPATVLFYVKGFRAKVLRDTTPLILCRVALFWTVDGSPIDHGKPQPSRFAKRSDCTTSVRKAPLAELDSVAVYQDSVVVTGSTRHGDTAWSETYVFGVLRGTLMGLREYRIYQMLYIDGISQERTTPPNSLDARQPTVGSVEDRAAVSVRVAEYRRSVFGDTARFGFCQTAASVGDTTALRAALTQIPDGATLLKPPTNCETPEVLDGVALSRQRMFRRVRFDSIFFVGDSAKAFVDLQHGDQVHREVFTLGLTGRGRFGFVRVEVLARMYVR